MVVFRDPRLAYKALNGVICVYKPANISVGQLRGSILGNICKDLNSLPDRPKEKRVEITGATNEPMSVHVVPNFADDPLVVGARYQPKDFKCNISTHLGLFSSGVFLLGLNEGTRHTSLMHLGRPTRAYKVHGQLGKATDTYFWNGKTVERVSYGHVTREKIDRVIAHIQAAHQQTMYKLSGLDMASETLYKMASQGVIRPAHNKLPILYGVKCVHFDPPNFTLEIQAVNEYDKYLWTLIHDFGIQLKSAAHCVGVQCIRHGKFDLHLALLRKHWTLQHIIENIKQCNELLEQNPTLLYRQSAFLS